MKVNTSNKKLKICEKGHRFYKASDCPTCPICEEERQPKSGFLTNISAPARRALENNGILTLKELSAYTEKDLLKLHGLGKSAIPKLKIALKAQGFDFMN